MRLEEETCSCCRYLHGHDVWYMVSVVGERSSQLPYDLQLQWWRKQRLSVPSLFPELNNVTGQHDVEDHITKMNNETRERVTLPIWLNNNIMVRIEALSVSLGMYIVFTFFRFESPFSVKVLKFNACIILLNEQCIPCTNDRQLSSLDYIPQILTFPPQVTRMCTMLSNTYTIDGCM